MDLKQFLNSTNELYNAFKKVVKENEKLKAKLAKVPIEYITPIEQLLVDENIIENKDEIKDRISKLLIQNNNKIKDKNCIVFFGADNSGSMSEFEYYIVKCFTIWLEKIFSKVYKNVSFKYYKHNVEVEEALRNDFFKKGKSGGTIASILFKKIKSEIELYNINKVDIYVFYFSDGDNLSTDNERTKNLITNISSQCKSVNYIEINQYSRNNILQETVKHICHKKFHNYIVKQKYDVHDVLKKIIQKITT